MTLGKIPILIQALDLPDGSRVDQRVPKKLLLENAATTAADKRLINDSIEQMQWVAALKPNTIGLAEYNDDQREYLEIAVLAVSLKDTVKISGLTRISELIHRAIPYPTLLLLAYQGETVISLAHKRWSQADSSKVVLDDVPTSVALSNDLDAKELITQDFLQSLSLSQPHISLLALYDSWIASVEALQAARLTGAYHGKVTLEQISDRRRALSDCVRLEAEADRIKVLAAKEKQIARQVELNASLKRIQTELAVARQKI